MMASCKQHRTVIRLHLSISKDAAPSRPLFDKATPLYHCQRRGLLFASTSTKVQRAMFIAQYSGNIPVWSDMHMRGDTGMKRIQSVFLALFILLRSISGDSR